MIIKRLRWLAILPAFILTTVAASELDIVNARLIDGNGSTPHLTSIEISHGVIVSIGGPSREDAEQIDARGANVMPGLIDSHVHLQSTPGTVFRKDDEETRLELQKHHLSAYLASGVTTILDAAISSGELRDIQRYLAEGGTGPQVMALGPTFHTPGGYLDGDSLSDYWGPRWRASASIDDVVALFSEYEGIPGLVGVKVPITTRVHPILPSTDGRHIRLKCEKLSHQNPESGICLFMFMQPSNAATNWHWKSVPTRSYIYPSSIYSRLTTWCTS